MSTALASARKRRAPQQTGPTPGVPNQQQSASISQNQPMNSNGLTLPQVITLVDRRLIVLETHMKENMQIRETDNALLRPNQTPVPSAETEVPENIAAILEEYNSRFEILAEEISNLKNIVLSLQSYTMDVNKVLLNERIKILSESEQSDTETALDLLSSAAMFSSSSSIN
jgi:hypothetical protein